MKDIKVIISCDDNPYYLDFWYPVSKIWKEYIGVTPVLVHVGTRNDVSLKYGEVHNIQPDNSLPIHTQAQLARLWYPKHEPETLWITSDIDMFPLSKTYWNEVIMNWEATKPDWTNLNSSGGNYFPLCYHVALGKMFANILELDDVFGDYVRSMIKQDKIKSFHTPENWNGDVMRGWNIDEGVVSEKIANFISLGGNVHQPHRIGGQNGRRLNKTNWSYEPSLVKSDYYIDCHSIRPYEIHKDEIENLLGLLK
jgi:hypothetical protein